MKPRPGPTLNSDVSLARALSKLGVASRSVAVRMIGEGRVKVDGKVIRDSEYWVDLRRQKITVDGKPAKKPEFVYLMMHKPAGVVTTRSDEKGRETVYDLLPDGVPWVSPVGRLDLESSGLLILTNDTQLGNRITDPSSGIGKVYDVTLASPVSSEDSALIEKGVAAEGVRYGAARVENLTEDRTRCRVTIAEGKNREIRRIFGAMGYEVIALHRVAVGGLSLGELPPGEVRVLDQEEIQLFK